MSDLLFEIGTEEIPAVYMDATLKQLEVLAREKLAEARIAHGEVSVAGTPRRLTLRVNEVADTQADAERVVRGPAVRAAYDDSGTPTKALEGFMRGQGVTRDQLETMDGPNGGYVSVKLTDKGKPTKEALGTLLPELVQTLSFPKFMRWGNAKMRFVRPLRWFVALLGSEVIPFELENIQSGNKTKGHRFLSPGEIEVSGADDYFEKLKTAYVMIDPQERMRVIREGAVQVASEAGNVVLEDDLLEENVYLVEYPTPLLGKFDESYLELPEPVLIMAMKKHEKFFPVRDEEGNLTAYFVSIRNSNADDIHLVREGNEWVLAARFNDAKFFFEEDLKHNLDHFVGRLDRLVFQEKLGTIKAKVERMEKLSSQIADHLAYDPMSKQELIEAARLAKADLSCGMVMELPALQGTIGAEYARREGKAEAIAEAIEQHYQPKGAGDALPDNPLARILSLCERIDTLVGYLGLGFMPTGSSDPFALRRAAQGVVEILAEEEEYPSFTTLQHWAYEAYQAQNVPLEPEEEIAKKSSELLSVRLNTLLEQEGIRYDLARAALGGGWSDSVSRLKLRAQTLQDLSQDEGWQAFVTAAVRPANIVTAARKNQQAFGERLSDVEDRLFELEQEIVLFETAASLSQDVTRFERMGDYERIYQTLQALSAPIQAFFDKVMVMDENPDKRRNRLTLMAGLQHLYSSLGDFTQVVLEGENS